uniref:Uncharacterized protein n=1 Tax=Anguilla anguilla TaxID=7936 RepID=A0A0E9QAM8_ANGAN
MSQERYQIMMLMMMKMRRGRLKKKDKDFTSSGCGGRRSLRRNSG